MKPYVIRQGDHLAKLAHLMRFDVDEVWNHPKNEALKALRSPTLLCPGDILFVPDRAPTPLPLRAGTKNRYVAKVPKVRLRLGFKDEAGAYRSEPYRVEGLNAVVEGETDAEGIITIAVPVMVRELSVVFPKRGVRHPIYLGDMDPVSEATGLRKRLLNDDIRETAAHEFGHSVLREAFSVARSLTHKGSSTAGQDRKPDSPHYPVAGEIDLMIYYFEEDHPLDFYARVIAAEEDTKGLASIARSKVT